LEYMKRQKYLGNWNHNGEKALPSDCKDPLNVMLTLEPPNWLKKDLDLISTKAAKYLPVPKSKSLSKSEFKQINEKSGLNVSDFADKIDVTKQSVYKILKGKMSISKGLTKKTKDVFPNL
jgi:DNA-binding XRE family transcriptional regulator